MTITIAILNISRDYLYDTQLQHLAIHTSNNIVSCTCNHAKPFDAA